MKQASHFWPQMTRSRGLTERVIGFFDAYRHVYPVSRGTLHGIADRFQQWGAVPRHAAGQGVSELALQTANTCSILFFGGDCIKNA